MNGLLCTIGKVKIGKVLNQNRPKNKKDYGDGAFNRLSLLLYEKYRNETRTVFVRRQTRLGTRMGKTRIKT